MVIYQGRIRKNITWNFKHKKVQWSWKKDPKKLLIDKILPYKHLSSSSPPVRWGLLDFMSISSPLRRPSSPPRLRSSSVSLSDLNYDLVCSVRRVGPQLRARVFSVACRTPTASSWVQCGVPDPTGSPWVECGVPDLNCDPASSVWRPGPQPRSCEFSVACRTSSIVSENLSERMTEDMSERMSEDMSEEMSKRYVRRYVRKNVKRYVRKNVRRYVRKACWLICVVLVAWRMMIGGSPYMLCWRVPANWKISFYWAWLTKWKIFYAKGPLLIFENWLTSWKPKVLPRWSACRTGLCMTQCKLPDIILCIWIQPLVGGAICWNKRWLNALEVYWHVWCLLFIPLICWQVVSWHDLACLVQRMLLVTHCNAFVIWACAVAATIAFDFPSGGLLPCLMPVSLYIFDRWYPDMIWHVCCGMFWHVCFCQVVYWHVLANGCVLFTWTLLTGAILSSRQDTTRSCKNPEKKDAGLAGFEMQENDVCHILKARQRHGARATCALQYHTFFPSADSICWDLFGLFQRTFSTSLDLFLLPVHGIKLDDNPHLTTPTQHVMVGITRSKVIFLVNLPWKLKWSCWICKGYTNLPSCG